MSPIVVGRASELEAVREATAAAGGGRGSALLLEGEPGVGKTRLTRAVLDEATAAGLLTLVGRGSQQAPAPYRPLTEALFALARRGAVPDDPSLRPFRGALGRIVADWRVDEDAVDETAVVVAEAVLRLLRVVSPPAGTLLVLDDLHWADPETLGVVEYLADNVTNEPIVLLLASRAEAGMARSTMAALEVRNALVTFPLRRLGGDDVAEMVRACAGSDVTADVIASVTERSDGLPLLVEELLAVSRDGRTSAPLPATFADAVQRRVTGLPAASILVLQSAAVLGRRFDWRLLAKIADVDEPTVLQALEEAVALQLVDVDHADDRSFRFHHALTCDVVLAGLLAPARAALAARAAAAVDGAGTDDAVRLAAELWGLAGDTGRAAARYLEAGRRAVASGALATARNLLRAGMELAELPEALEAELGEALADAHARAAAVDDALAVAERTLELLERDSAGDPARRARLHLVVGRAAVGATRWHLAREHVEIARRLAEEAGDRALGAIVTAVDAHVAMGELRLEEAVEAAVAARAAAAVYDLPEVACEALEIIGRRERLRDLGAAERSFAEAREIAMRHGLRLAAIRALHELGTVDMLRTSGPGRLIEARDLAEASGALSLTATVDLQLLGLYGFRFEVEQAIAVGEALVDRTARLAAPELHSAALLQLAFAYALAQRRRDMEEAVRRALLSSGGHPEARALAAGHVRATYSLFHEDRGEARSHLRTAVTIAREARGVPGVFPVLWALVEIVEGAGEEVLDEVAMLDSQSVPMNQSVVGIARAILAWRDGDDRRAAELFSRSDRVLVEKVVPGIRHLALRLAGEAALRGGFGAGPTWLREAMDFFVGTGHDRIVLAATALLREAGEPVPRVRARQGVPPHLRARGITARELEVLELVRQRLSNREIADRLFLSTRTVEKHVERLLQKTGSRSRGDLAAAPDT